MITVKIGGIDKTSLVKHASLIIHDRINDEVNTCRFKMRSVDGYKPSIGDTIEITQDTDVIFGGALVLVEETEPQPNRLEYTVECKDWSHYLNRLLVNQVYLNKTAKYIIEDIIENYTVVESGVEFTTNNTGGDGVIIQSLVCDRMPVVDAIQKLADSIGYSWYIDYDQDIHFFDPMEDGEDAPFGLIDSDTADQNYIMGSLVLTSDLTQIRNAVTVRGGEERGESRTLSIVADGEADTFNTGYKFAEAPTVLVDSVEQTVGVDYLNNFTDFDVLWSYGEKYIRFENPPDADAVVSITGIPLFQILIQREDQDSIDEYGRWEIAFEQKSIRSRVEAIDYAGAQLKAYKDGIIEGSFRTKTPGLASGQTINITSTRRDINEDYVIQSVTATVVNSDNIEYYVTIARLKTIKMVDILKRLLSRNEPVKDEVVGLLQFAQEEDTFEMEDEFVSATTSQPPYLIAPADAGSDVPGTNYLKINLGTISA